MNDAQLTIFTPTYNRGYIIKNCYESLCQQTNKDFYWLIVDDGSTDNTEELVESWKRENKLNITYIKQENSGKHVAHNTGVLNCKTDVFVCVDSDDYLTEDAVSVIYNQWEKINSNHSLAGMIALKGYANGKPTGTRMPSGINQCKMFDLYQKYGFKGDAIIILRTEVLRKNLFPVFDGEKFVTEAVVYDKIDQEYEVLLVDRLLYICDYLEDGYSRNILKVHRASPKGYMFFLSERINYAKSLTDRYKAISYFLAGRWRVKHKQPIEYLDYKILYLLAIPKAIIIFIKPIIKNLLIKFGVFK
ncbi:glycosyltransferase family A protein [Priestia megaterium]|uniref:glycosyltransferase family A protein n=1 Tax=Priestia megaterium TaxID=1404 RepID=UPI000BFDCE25|nr:glycosyltransferase family 2 protein [Priestia megaterium]PGT76796.1 glycosyl transferase family 2 [Priestia megaterium]